MYCASVFVLKHCSNTCTWQVRLRIFKIMNKQMISRKERKERRNYRPELDLRPAYPGQNVYQTKVCANPYKLTTTVTTGVISSTVAIDFSKVDNSAVRFAAFSEYRIIKAVFNIVCCSSTNPGVAIAWIDEKSATTPTQAMAFAAKGQRFNCSSVDRNHILTWTSNDPLDLQYVALGTAPNLAFMKVYTNNAVLGSSIVATDYLIVEPTYTVQFRGFV